MKNMNRRTFIRTIAASGIALPMISTRPIHADSPNGQLRIGGIGVGDKGCMFRNRLFPREKFAGFEYPVCTGDDHYMQWTLACLDRSRKTVTPFATFSSPMTEAVLLGNIALRFPGQKLTWGCKGLYLSKHERCRSVPATRVPHRLAHRRTRIALGFRL